ncbi:MAG: class I SAM-dependent methyltransferase [Thermoplasmatales archaeon]|nr:MAG: class I SAM-dependent methyltransferase [Thermoplasmatales archaeon]
MSVNTISESAFLVNESRSRRVDISKDIYSHLWTTDSTAKLWKDFSSQVYPYDDIELGLRNRFFLEHLNSFIEKTHNPVFVNIASGFTSYPFLIKNPCKCIEIDLRNVIDFKQKKIKTWIEKGTLPQCNITFLPVDINKKADIKRLKKSLISIFKNNPSFILLEGITYYLNKQVLNNLFNMISEVQLPDSILTFDFWKPTNSNHPVFKRLSRFFAERFSFKETQYTFLDFDFIQTIQGYESLELTDIQELEKRFTKNNYLDNYDKIIPEYYAVLKLQK